MDPEEVKAGTAGTVSRKEFPKKVAVGLDMMRLGWYNSTNVEQSK